MQFGVVADAVESSADQADPDQPPEADEPGGETQASAARVPDENGLLPHSRQGGNPKAPLAVGGFSSSHPIGVNFALGDGSVRFIADKVSEGLMRRLAHRSDGKIIDAVEW
jgi:hypothetical protein